MDSITAAPVNVGADIAFFRSKAGITQSQLAVKAGVNQSRISRLEKGESATTAEINRVISALSALGSKDAIEYSAYLSKEWEHIERPEFSNSQREILAFAEEALKQIATFLTEEERPWPLKRQLERQRAAIQASAIYLGKNVHQIAFIGEIGVGKSTAISFLFDLLDPTTAGGELTERVVLETGGGHTTLCEVNIRRGPGFGIVVQALSDEEVRNRIGDFCAAVWLRKAGSGAEKNENVNVSEELQRALRNMSGLTPKRERDANGRFIYRDQVAELASQCATEEEFRARVTERMRLEFRTRREIWVEDSGMKGAMPQLRRLFRDINNGRLADVPLPSSIDLLIPAFGSELPGLVVSAIDTMGLNELVVRADLDARLKDTRTHVVLCSTFNQAPNTSVQLLLDHLRNAHGLRVDSGKVSVLVLPYDEQAMAVKDDSGEPPVDYEDAYNLKKDQIIRSTGGDDGMLQGVPIFFFNAKKDDAAKARAHLVEQIVRLRKSYEDRLLDEFAAADEVIRHHETQAFTAAVQAVADRLGHFLRAYSSLPPRVRQPSQELIEAMVAVRYASTIWAMTRRRGEYYNFSVTHQVGAGGARDALLRCRTWFEKLQGVLDTLKQDADLVLAQKTIQQVETSAAGWRQAFAEAARTAAVEVYREPLEADAALWSRCVAQWGAGPGFKMRVERLIRDWFEAQTELNQKLESIMASLWEASVIKPLERLSDESAGEQSEDDARPVNVIPFTRPAAG
jgi:transcriptional regulator with XRE-family HTH domain